MKKKRPGRGTILFSIVAVLSSLTLTGCGGLEARDAGTRRPPASRIPCADQVINIPSANVMPTIFQVAQGLAFQLRQNLREDDLRAWPCIVTSFADIDNLNSSSRFGRLLAEAVSSQLFRQGAVIRDVRSAKSLFVQPRNGELILSRNAKSLAKQMDARAVIAGTYGKGASSVAVNIRMIDLQTRAVVSVAMTELARTPAIEALLGREKKTGKMDTPLPTAYDIQVF